MSEEQLEQAIAYNSEMLDKRISEEIFKEDILNVTGSMFSTFLDYVDNSNNELEKLQQERDLYKKVIEEVRELIEKSIVIEGIRETGIGYYENIKANKTKLLQILDKVKEEPKENKYKLPFDKEVQEGLDSLTIRSKDNIGG